MRSEIRTAIIFGIVITVGVATASIVFSTLETRQDTTLNAINDVSELVTQSVDKSRFKQAPDLVGVSGYINTTPQELEHAMKDKVVLYDIWTYSCINCIRTLPYLTAWDEKYSDEGLLIIGIHSPEFEFEKDIKNVQMAVDKYGIKYPVILDNDWETWDAFKNRYWPHKFIADNEGYIRYDHIGEGGYKKTEQVIQLLLEERATQIGLKVASAEPLVDIEEFEHTSFRTPELYFGYKFASGRNQLGNEKGFSPGNEVTYSIPDKLTQNNFYLDGTWKNLEGSMRLVSDSGAIVLSYFAKEVNIVTANEAELTMYIDDKPLTADFGETDVSSNGKLFVKEDDLYNIINSENPESHILKIVVSDPGFEIYAFTFG